MEIPITQSEVWQKLENDLNEQSFFEKADGYQYLAILKSTPLGNYLYLPYGPVAKDRESFKKSLRAIKSLAAKTKAIFIRIEPKDITFAKFLPKNSQKSKDLSPKDTWVLDLTPAQSALVAGFSQGTRTRYNTFAKKGLVVEKTTDPDRITHLVKLQQALAKLRGIHAYDPAYLKTELSQPFATLYLVKYHKASDISRSESKGAGNYPKDGQILAASLFFDYAGTRYYMQSAADTEFKKLPATVALLTTAIFDAKEQGIKHFDFWGIAPDDAPADHPWKGFTEFKKSFGGEPRHYAGTYDIIMNPIRYKLYQAIRAFNRFLRHR